MAQRHTNQEWQSLLEQYESAHLSQKVFCERHGLSLSTFHAKRQQLRRINGTTHSGFVQAEIVETKTHYQAAQIPVANMTLSVNHIELSVPQGTPVAYLAELIGALA
ncbi:IS66 family insertion sequence element accessory protein TnpB [Vibrio sp. S11_S32]|uniref:IS66 family insertion sequence element accessory protein TnpA n=1 Tax=Vibrio sp. S11_S32 TaxID=2720225 RepID=UPI0016809FE9|nr:IS66 family insertion sequence element accessory protein TnpB [Vibrio sp. S11_S32]MBD1578040.1 IS66 family insertion sequence element accessory protein TnpB [Vibrio sp. S11_S32]